MNKQKSPNRLIHSKSPYLLQHAYNPVEWYEWGEEAFQRAKQEDKPVLVSIGYSTCHWCHVMAHESFEDEDVAKILNERFVAIKVDREERPDIDSVYMKACQMMTGQGGWPLNVFVTPEQKPFYAGMYFPKESKYGRPGFKEVLVQLYDQYKENSSKIYEVSNQLIEALQQTSNVNQEESLSKDILHQTYQQLSENIDEEYGGFTDAPKFPTPHMLMFLMRYYKWTNEKQALNMVTKTLDGMADGGIYDHIGFGFARYSTDSMWLVPHFEKMLYDNALLLMAYIEAYQITKNERYKKVSQEIITFIKREMTGKKGGFYSALDADTEGEEGKYYIWDYKEIFNILGPELGKVFVDVYNITPKGNFEGENIPNLINTNLKKVATNHQFTVEKLKEQLEIARKRLFEVRLRRTYPHVDDKILTSWNALMVAAIAKAYQVFDIKDYKQLAEKGVQFLEQYLIVDGRIMVRFREGEVKNKGFIDD